MRGPGEQSKTRLREGHAGACPALAGRVCGTARCRGSCVVAALLCTEEQT